MIGDIDGTLDPFARIDLSEASGARLLNRIDTKFLLSVPTLTRVLIEALEEAVDLGGGKVLVFGCAAGDVGIAALFEVTDGGVSG